MSGRPELRLDELLERRADAEAVLLPHVIVVEEDREQPHVVSRGFLFFVGVGADGARRTLAGRAGDAAVELDELEVFDRLRLAVFGDFEVGLLEVGDVRAAAVGHDDVDADEVDARAEHGVARAARGGVACCAWLATSAKATAAKAMA